ncbi:leucine-rich repeat receptor-like serine/threonine/tyrosine-protein kinase SOBIR1 [Citrus sinensis]|uniref:leucine-rich repeat receptor-like serine/threonine/tyrosine-protein kinase SOBIR1 n=1 Tax=Citrus sinensis TaxID=2711 RepID=UPI00219AFDA2|nr:leucine-rich repeat receptor-like serine/threonine/tyrosine-protein kinase SOBIR1 [Citrus sinensis]KAH9727150.1 leucine-rich repeat receptor-like serine/threonine/tyrosine-protein kinase SOBIR1 [Citrus sinensis]
MPKLTLDNSFRFLSQEETTSCYFHSESIETIIQNLESDWLQKFAGEAHIQADLMGWIKMLVKISEVVDDAVEKQMTNQHVKLWLGELQNLACDVEYLFDEFQTEAFRSKLLPLDYDYSTDDEFDSLAKTKVMEIHTRLQGIASQIDSLELKGISGGKSRNVRKRLSTISLVSEAKVYGRVKAKKSALRGRGGGRYRGPAICTRPNIKKGDIAFLTKEDSLASLEIIGVGACGVVYKAEVPGSYGKMIAIKKIDQPPMAATELLNVRRVLINRKMRQIKTEIITAGRIWHRNLLPLQAHVTRPDCHLLVYEFMKNGSLHGILYDVSQGRKELDWLARYRIARGIASGLEYLHMYHRPCIIHRDIKPANVLIDDGMEARISDFGLAKLMPDGHTRIRITNVAGTVGYIAPEYQETLTISEKCDIYSFGVLLAVLVMGKFPFDDFFQYTEEMNMVRWMRNVMTSENPHRAIDSKLFGNGYEEQMLLVLKIAYFCTLDDPKERPSSKDVRCMLSQIKH